MWLTRNPEQAATGGTARTLLAVVLVADFAGMLVLALTAELWTLGFDGALGELSPSATDDAIASAAALRSIAIVLLGVIALGLSCVAFGSSRDLVAVIVVHAAAALSALVHQAWLTTLVICAFAVVIVALVRPDRRLRALRLAPEVWR